MPSGTTRKLIRTIELDHPLKFHHAIHKCRMVEVYQDDVRMGYGRISEFDGEVVTLYDRQTQSRIYYTIYVCKFYAEVE